MIAFAYEFVRRDSARNVSEWIAHRREVADDTREHGRGRVHCDAHGKEFVVTHEGVPLPCCDET